MASNGAASATDRSRWSPASSQAPTGPAPGSSASMQLAPMAKTTRVETARKAFAAVTGALEDATIVAADGEAAPNLAATRQSRDHLIALLESCLEQLQRLQRRLG